MQGMLVHKMQVTKDGKAPRPCSPRLTSWRFSLVVDDSESLAIALPPENVLLDELSP